MQKEKRREGNKEERERKEVRKEKKLIFFKNKRMPLGLFENLAWA